MSEMPEQSDDTTTEATTAPTGSGSASSGKAAGKPKATAEPDANSYPEDQFSVEQLVLNASTLLGEQYPSFLVSAALAADGEAYYTADDARALVDELASKPVEA